MPLKDKIFASQDALSETVPMPEWDCSIQIRGISAEDCEAWQLETYERNKTDGGGAEAKKIALRTRLLIQCAFDPDSGEKVFTDADVERLNAKPNRLIERLYKVAERLNAVSPTDIDDLAKN